MKKKELFNLKVAIIGCGELSGAKFAYALAKNLNAIETEIKLIEGSKPKPSDALKKFSDEETEIIKKHAKKDEKGEFVVKNDWYVFDNIKLLNKDLEQHKEDNPEVIKELETLQKDYEALLDTDADFKPYYIDINIVDDKITANQMKSISCLFE